MKLNARRMMLYRRLTGLVGHLAFFKRKAARNVWLALYSLLVIVFISDLRTANAQTQFTYTYAIVGTNGQAGITGIIGAPSINDAGECVFPVQVSGGETMYVGDASGNLTNINPSLISSTRTFSSFLKINDSNLVVAQETVSGSPPSYLIRTWNPASPGSWQLMAEGQNNKSVLVPWMNNNGQIAYLGFDGTYYHLYTTNSAGGMYYQFNLTNSICRPMIADNGSIVGKIGSATSSGSLRVFAGDFSSYADVAVAGGGQFSSLDSLPGISEDGQVVAFYGSDSGGPGIFIATAGPGGFSTSIPYRVAGPTNGFSAFPTFSRVAVKTVPGELGFVSYLGTQNGIFGLFVSEFQSGGPATPPLVSSPSLVVAIGQTMTNLAGTVQSISIHDPINTNAVVAFLVQMTTGAQAVIEATPSGFYILPHFDSTITADPNGVSIMAAINAAIQTLHTNLTDNFIGYVNYVNDKDPIDLTNGTLGSSETPVSSYPYSTYLAALKQFATSANDRNAITQLPNGSTEPVTGGSQVALTQALARHLGLPLAGGGDGFDSKVSLVISKMNITRPAGNNENYDLQTTVEHENDEVLGTSSGLPDTTPIWAMDLFRYTTNLARTYNTNGDNAYFSVDGTNLWARFNMDSDGDYGDWWSPNGDEFWAAGGNTPGSQVQDAFGEPGTFQDLGPNELAMLDVVGWTPAGSTVQAVAPTLKMIINSPGQITISWPQDSSSYSLQQSTGLSQAGPWMDSPSGTTNPAVISITGTQMFYRLYNSKSPAIVRAKFGAAPDQKTPTTKFVIRVFRSHEAKH